MKLLTTGNPKTLKGVEFGYLTAILHLAPSTLSGFNVCPMASKACAFACLNTAGRGGIMKPGETTNMIQDARIRKTRMLFNERDKFLSQLKKEITNFVKLAAKHNLKPAIRLNGTSDIRWENYGIIEMFPNVQFYDYTKLPNRRNLPSNYHLTFSLSEDNDASAKLALSNGLNVAAVFRLPMPAKFMGRTVVNGDVSDLRFTDPSGVIVGLKAKGKAKKDTSGFVRN